MEELDLKQLINIFWNKRKQILIVVLVCIILGAAYSFLFVKPKYKSYTTILLTKVQAEVVDGQEIKTTETITQTDLTLNQKLIATYSELIKSKNVLREVIKNLGINHSEDALKSKITVSAIEDTELIQISVVDADPIIAKQIANETARVFSKKVAEIYNINNVYTVDAAEVADEPYNINHIKDILIFAVIGLVISAVYVLVANMLDTTVKSQEDVENVLELTVLASIPFINDDPKNILKGGIN